MRVLERWKYNVPEGLLLVEVNMEERVKLVNDDLVTDQYGDSYRFNAYDPHDLRNAPIFEEWDPMATTASTRVYLEKAVAEIQLRFSDE